MNELTVSDLIERHGDVFYEQLCHGRVVALSGKTGRQLFDTHHNRKEHIEKYYPCKVISMWADMKTRPDSGFSGTWCQPVTMIYIREK